MAFGAFDENKIVIKADAVMVRQEVELCVAIDAGGKALPVDFKNHRMERGIGFTGERELFLEQRNPPRGFLQNGFYPVYFYPEFGGLILGFRFPG